MKRHELLALLCYDGPESPYPLESLYDLEGLGYVELQEAYRAVQRGDRPPAIARGGARRRLAEQLGASQEQGAALAQGAGPALEQLGRTASRLQVRLGQGDLRARVDALERAVELLVAQAGAQAPPTEPAPASDEEDHERARLGRLTALTDTEDSAADW